MENYPVPAIPAYDPEIPALTNAHNSSAEGTFGPLFKRLIENIHFVKKLADAVKAGLDTLVGPDGKPITGNPHKLALSDLFYKQNAGEWDYESTVQNFKVNGRWCRVGPLLFYHGTLTKTTSTLSGALGFTLPKPFADANRFVSVIGKDKKLDLYAIMDPNPANLYFGGTLAAGDVVVWQAWGFEKLPSSLPNAPA